MNIKSFRTIFEYISTVFAAVLYAVALQYFVFPAHIILTGTEGIAISISYFFDNEWIFIALYSFFQFSLLLFGFFKISRRFVFRTLLIVGIVIGTLSVLPEFALADPEPTSERIILSIFGGILAGIAKAIAFRNKASTGDEDIPGAYFSSKYLKPVGTIAVIAAIISTAFGMTLDFIRTGRLDVVINTLMYTSIYIFISTETLNNFYRKFKLTLINVITKSPENVGNAIKAAFPHRTYTIRQGTGGRSKEKLQILQTIITHEELPNAKRIIETADEDAFFYYNDLEGVSKKYYIPPIG